jgi:hypothetical protein
MFPSVCTYVAGAASARNGCFRARKMHGRGPRYASHSMRSGWISTAARNGASVWKMKEISRHNSTGVLAGYIREASCSISCVGRDVSRGRDGGTALPRLADLGLPLDSPPWRR